MTDSRFKSLSIGDRVVLAPVHQETFKPHTVTNQFIRVIDGQPLTFVHLSNAGRPIEVPEYAAPAYDFVGGAR